MLRFNSSPDTTGLGQDVWKVLIYDQFCRDLISPLMNVKDLRAEGVTLHMYVNQSLLNNFITSTNEIGKYGLLSSLKAMS